VCSRQLRSQLLSEAHGAFMCAGMEGERKYLQHRGVKTGGHVLPALRETCMAPPKYWGGVFGTEGRARSTAGKQYSEVGVQVFQVGSQSMLPGTKGL